MSRIRQIIRFGKILLKDARIPKPVRAVMGACLLIPIPGPFDEAAFLLILAAVYLAKGDVVRECWAAAR